MSIKRKGWLVLLVLLLRLSFAFAADSDDKSGDEESVSGDPDGAKSESRGKDEGLSVSLGAEKTLYSKHDKLAFSVVNPSREEVVKAIKGADDPTEAYCRCDVKVNDCKFRLYWKGGPENNNVKAYSPVKYPASVPERQEFSITGSKLSEIQISGVCENGRKLVGTEISGGIDGSCYRYDIAFTKSGKSECSPKLLFDNALYSTDPPVVTASPATESSTVVVSTLPSNTTTAGTEGEAEPASFPWITILIVVVVVIVLAVLGGGFAFWYYRVRNSDDDTDSIEKGNKTDGPESDFAIPADFSKVKVVKADGGNAAETPHKKPDKKHDDEAKKGKEPSGKVSSKNVKKMVTAKKPKDLAKK